MSKRAFFLSSLAFSAMATAQAETKVDFVTQIKPLFEGTCVSCHNEDKAKGEYRMDTKEFAFAGGDLYPDETIIPGKPDDSSVYWMTTEPADSEDVMPPKKQLTVEQQDLIKEWIAQGADWPDGVTLTEQPRMDFTVNIEPLLEKGGPFSQKEQRLLNLWVAQGAVWPEGITFASVKAGEEPKKDDGPALPADDLALVERMRADITAASTEENESDMKDYTTNIPVAGADLEMLAIKGGEFTMGSPEGESGRFDDEGAQHKVKVAPFWMGKFEITWDQYEPFMITSVARQKNGAPVTIEPDAAPIDVVSSPTTPYVEMSFGMGTSGYPAISMTQHAALKYCQWLSAQTGHFYRLPTEAEWEYACRAGTTGAFHCAPEQLAEYAVFDPDQTRSGYEPVGTKKPNPWGLHDMHGNVMEWVLDQYLPNIYADRKGGAENPLAIPETLYPRVARGGSWYDPPEELRSARRIFSDAEWKIQDPQLPKSIWYHTDAHWLGFRVVRPLETPSAEEMHRIWNQGLGEE